MLQAEQTSAEYTPGVHGEQREIHGVFRLEGVVFPRHVW